MAPGLLVAQMVLREPIFHREACMPSRGDGTLLTSLDLTPGLFGRPPATINPQESDSRRPGFARGIVSRVRQ